MVTSSQAILSLNIPLCQEAHICTYVKRQGQTTVLTHSGCRWLFEKLCVCGRERKGQDGLCQTDKRQGECPQMWPPQMGNDTPCCPPPGWQNDKCNHFKRSRHLLSHSQQAHTALWKNRHQRCGVSARKKKIESPGRHQPNCQRPNKKLHEFSISNITLPGLSKYRPGI